MSSYLHRKPMSWWPSRSSKTVKVSEGAKDGGKKGDIEEMLMCCIIILFLISHRK